MSDCAAKVCGCTFDRIGQTKTRLMKERGIVSEMGQQIYNKWTVVMTMENRRVKLVEILRFDSEGAPLSSLMITGEVRYRRGET